MTKLFAGLWVMALLGWVPEGAAAKPAQTVFAPKGSAVFIQPFLQVTIEELDQKATYKIEARLLVENKDGKFPLVVGIAGGQCLEGFFGPWETTYEAMSHGKFRVRLRSRLEPLSKRLSYEYPKGSLLTQVAKKEPSGQCVKERIAVERFKPGNRIVAEISLFNGQGAIEHQFVVPIPVGS